MALRDAKLFLVFAWGVAMTAVGRWWLNLGVRPKDVSTPMNFMRSEIEQYLRQFLTDHRFSFVIDGKDGDSFFVAYQSEGLLLAFYWSINDGSTFRVGRLSSIVAPSTLRELVKRCTDIPYYFPSFFRRYTNALDEHEYPSRPTEEEFYRLMDLSLREFVSNVESGRIKVSELKAG